MQWLGELKDSMVSVVTLTTTDRWELKHFDKLVLNKELTDQTKTYKTRTSNHRVEMRMRYGEGKSADRVIIEIEVSTGPPHVKANFLLTMCIVDQKHYRHVILHNHSINVWSDAITYHYEVVTPTLNTLMRLAWEDHTLHIVSYLEEVVFDSTAVDVEPPLSRHCRLLLR